MDVILFILLTFCCVFFTLLTIVLEDYLDIRGFGLVLAIMSVVFWIGTGISAINITSTEVLYDVTIGEIVEHTITYDATWPITILFCLASIFPLLLVLKKIPETWPGVDKE